MPLFRKFSTLSVQVVPAFMAGRKLRVLKSACHLAVGAKLVSWLLFSGGSVARPSPVAYRRRATQNATF